MPHCFKKTITYGLVMRYSGFSLVELSLVLVILGLLTGGILAGRSLIRASELRAVATEYQRYVTAAQSFRGKYFYLPGDLPNATAVWGDQATGTGACADSSVPDGSPGTCNGDGNGFILTASGANASGEMFRFWQQLALAGLVEGSYSGISGPAGSIHAVIGSNVPPSKVPAGGWSVRSIQGYFAGNPTSFAGTYGNFFDFGAAFAAPVNGSTYSYLLKPEELWNIDTKLDDGKPSTGKLLGVSWTTCATGAASETDIANATYNLVNSNIICSASFLRAF